MSPLHRGTRRRIPTDPRREPVPRPWLPECTTGSHDFARGIFPALIKTLWAHRDLDTEQRD